MGKVENGRHWLTSNYFTLPLTVALVVVVSHYQTGDTLQLTLLKVGIVPLSSMSEAFINFRYVSEASRTSWTLPYLEKQLFRAVSLSGFLGTLFWAVTDDVWLVIFRYLGMFVGVFLTSLILQSRYRTWPPTTR